MGRGGKGGLDGWGNGDGGDVEYFLHESVEFLFRGADFDGFVHCAVADADPD